MNIGIVGNGMIIDMAGEAITRQSDFTCTAIVCRLGNRDKAEKYAKKFQIPRIYTDYQEFLEHAPVEAVYIGIVNSEHYHYAKQALLAGKHVILEKPFTVSQKEAKELAQIAGETGKMLLEAIYIRYCGWMESVRKGAEHLGRIKLIQCSYSQRSSRYDQYCRKTVLPVFDPALGGGALFDLGIYCVHFVDTVMKNEKIQGISYKANRGFNGVDTSGVLTISYPESLAVCVCAKDSDGARQAVIQGEEGWIKVEPFPVAERVVLYKNHSDEVQILWQKTDSEKNFLLEEFQELSHILKGNLRDRAETGLEESLRVMEVLEQTKNN